MIALEKQAGQEKIKEMSLIFVIANAEVFKQSNPLGFFIYEDKGYVSLFYERKIIFPKNSGNFFGDTALLYGWK